MQSHAGGLQRGGTVTVDRDSGEEVVAELNGDDSGDVEARLTGGLAATEHEVVDLGGVEFGDLCQRGGNHLSCEVIRADVLERTLHCAADGRPYC